MPATNYLKPSDTPYKLVRIRSTLAQILDPEILDEILSLLEVTDNKKLWDALYRSQPFHSMRCDPSGAHWRKGRFYASSAAELHKCFPAASQQGLL